MNARYYSDEKISSVIDISKEIVVKTLQLHTHLHIYYNAILMTTEQ